MRTCVFLVIGVLILSLASANQIFDLEVKTTDPWLANLEYPNQIKSKGETKSADYQKLNNAIDTLLNWNIKMCSSCESLKFFAIRPLASTSQYLTVASTCTGTVSFSAAPAPGRPGANQLLIATRLSDDTWLLEPSTCLGKYIKATSPTSMAVLPGLSSNARHWIEYHDNHVHLKSAFYTSSYWSGGSPIQLDVGATAYIVEFWPTKPWP